MDGLSRQIRQRIEQINAKLSEAEKDTLLGGIQKLPKCFKNHFNVFHFFWDPQNLGISKSLLKSLIWAEVTNSRADS